MLDLLHSLSKGLEDWSDRHAHTISLLEAVSTTAAVIVALAATYAAKRNSRPRLAAKVEVNLIIYQQPGSPTPAYVTVRLTNRGSVPVRLSSTFFTWGLPFVRNRWLVHSPVSERGDDHVPMREFPIVLQPWTSANIFLTPIEPFTNEALPAILNNGRFGRKLSARLLRGYIYTDDGSQFRAKFGTSFRKQLRKTADVPP